MLVSAEELGQWPAAAAAALKPQGLLAKARPAASAICPGCERECTMPVHPIPAGPLAPTSFIVCDKRSDINRAPFPPPGWRNGGVMPGLCENSSP